MAQGGNLLVLKDGRTFSSASIRRVDLPLAHLAEIERLLRPPLLPSQVERANPVARALARRARSARA